MKNYKISPIDLHLAKKLKEIRIAEGISQEKLGELVGITFQQIQKYETAKNRISAATLFEFSQILEKPITAFFEGLKSDRSYYNYDFSSDKKLIKNLQKFNKESLALMNYFNQIEDLLVRKNLTSLAKSLVKKKKKKVKHSFS
jgi:transcriptional regulator with XRE-family HTH domain